MSKNLAQVFAANPLASMGANYLMYSTTGTAGVDGAILYSAFQSGIVIAESQVTNLVSDLASKVSSVTGTSNRITITGTTTPQVDIAATYVGQTSIITLGTIATGTWSATNIALNKGGTNASLVADNGGIFYSTATAAAILSGTSLANRALLSGALSAPTFSTTTYPPTTTINQLLWSPANNSIIGLATANNSVLTTSSGGVPSLTASLPPAVQDNIVRLGTIVNIGSPLGSTFGGSGVTSPTLHGILVSQGTGPFSPKVLTNGQLLIGSTSNDPVAALPTSGDSSIVITPTAGGLDFAVNPVGIGSLYPPNFINGFLTGWNNGLSIIFYPGYSIDSSFTTNIVQAVQSVLDSTTNGISGLDTGSLQASKTYYIYSAQQGTNTASTGGIMSLSASAPSFASAPGYNKYFQITTVTTNASVNFENFVQTSNGKIVNITVTSLTFLTGHRNTIILASNGSTQTFTVPATATGLWTIGDTIQVFQQGAGQVVFAAAGGVTIQSMFSNLKIGAQYSSATLTYINTDIWKLEGNLTT